MVKHTGKLANGQKKELVTPKKTYAKVELNAEAKQAKEASLAAQREKRLLKSAKKNTDTGFESLGTVTVQTDLDWLVEWMQEDTRKGIVGFLCSLARQGHLEKAWKGITTPLSHLNLGSGGLGNRVISRPNQKFRAIGTVLARSFLSKILGIQDLDSWFRGEGKLDPDIAPKALFNILGVMEGSPLPTGHEDAQYEVPLLWLFIRTWEALGCRGKGATKETLDDITDYFGLKAEPTRVVLNFRGVNEATGEQVIDIGVDMAKADDWYIANPHSYEDAAIISDKLGIEQSLRKKSELVHGAPPFDRALVFPKASAGKEICFKADDGKKSVDEIIQTLRAKEATELEKPSN